MAYKQQKFIFHSSGCWEVQDLGAGRFGVWWRKTSFWFYAFLFIGSHGTAETLHNERVQSVPRPLFSSVQSLSHVRLFATPWLQHTRLPCPSPAPGDYSDSWPSSWWCHSTISSSVIPFSSCLQSFPASGSCPMSQFFTSGGQSIGVSASASDLPMNAWEWSPLGWTGWISLQSCFIRALISFPKLSHFPKALYLQYHDIGDLLSAYETWGGNKHPMQALIITFVLSFSLWTLYLI